ncbi:MAG: Asp-tRNA(Asn)/Glu-tRNA(Gln) amidotransferase subunit GatC [Campylobacterota bacterium]|nr:Asp-tRNA(Asn)/Glu-tRNA(Gln) amidotransferase subunit GatC [Campylobacterota bacterium]
MIIDNTTVDKLAKLSSLNIDDDKKEIIASELADIASFVENLNEIDVSHVDATFTTIDGGQPLRDDIDIKEDGVAEHIISHAPNTEENYFIVPAIIE